MVVQSDSGFRSGFVSVVGRPNVGKSTLVNRLVGAKVSIVSDKPQTTRNEIRGVLTGADYQIVFLDTPGLHRPRTLLGERVNQRAHAALDGADVVCFVVEANGPIGPGDRFIADLVSRVGSPMILAVNKVDAATPAVVGEQLVRARDELGDPAAFVPVSARTGQGCDALLDEIVGRLGPGPQYYPADVVTDQPEAFLAAEFLREQLIAGTRDEIPHSIAVVVDEIKESGDEAPLITVRARVLVERESQKGIVIGKKGESIKRAGTRARQELERVLGARVYLETRVKVERNWQRRAGTLDRLDL
jgi:GTP-binding protein Era